jgi:peptidoglycan-N-acetylglucosamine deacetylase
MTPTHRLLSVLAIYAWSTAALAQSLSLTFDDGLDPTRQPRAKEWNDQILLGLRKAGVTSMVFPSLSRTGGEAGLDLIREWAEAGHYVGNHTSGHRDLSSPELTLEEFIADVTEADVALRNIPRFVPMLRFPYLKEGNTVVKRDGIRQWMKANGYAPAAVSIDTSDWYYNQLFVAFTDARSSEKATQVKKAYIAHLLERATYYDRLARQVLGRSPKHVMLLHTSAINAASVQAIVAAFRARGWRFMSPMGAFSDPMYALRPNIVPAGESIVWALAKERGVKGLRYPDEDSVYEEPKLRSLGLVPKSNGS